ncbi:MAG TPA: ATP-binding protein [Bryobacteraceae bacterium]|jgi:signal transduction histidine kinase|nr:ATP-binding protein [Bryobacteraceae bacterium]
MARILIVDDSEMNRYVRSEILRKAGHESLFASSGTQALELCMSEKPDMVLLDIHLPDVNGFEVCRRIKTNPETAWVMVMQITASAVELKDALTGLNGGADDFLVDPVEPELLAAKVRSLMRLRMVEERLRKSNEELSRFAFVASHDLQEPLRNVVTFAQLLERDYREKLDERGATYLDYIIGGGKRMTVLIRDLLDYSRISPNVMEHSHRIDMDRIVDQTRDWFKERLAEAKAEIGCDPLPEIEGVEVRVSQLVRNLIENAIKYRRPEVPLRIHIGVRPAKREWIFAFSDNGKGFDPAYTEEIFGIFRRLGRDDVGGTGIGLAICRSVVESVGGRIWAEGRPGEGATFYFTWPVASETAAVPATAPENR